MYEDAETQVKAILKIVSLCPESLQEKCFEILLQGYVSSHTPTRGRHAAADAPPPPPPSRANGDGAESSIPPELANRFRTTAKRLDVPVKRLESLFDFNSEPIIFHALHIPGDAKADKTRNVALLVAAKSYLTTGAWTADWKEVKSQCVDQNCYDAANFATMMKRAQADLFKSLEIGKSMELSSGGVKEAEGLLKKLSASE